MQPGDSVALHLLGIIALQPGPPQLAADSFGRSLAVWPRSTGMQLSS